MVPLTPNPSRRLRRLGAALLGFVLTAIVIFVGKNRKQFQKSIDAEVEKLLSNLDQDDDAVVTESDWEGVPDPVARYFETVLSAGQPHVRSVRLTQRGEFRLGGRDAQWRPLEATQHVTVSPPGFVWDACIDVLPLVPARVIDTYSQGDGWLEARLLSAVTVAHAGPSPEMDSGELVRYLAEAVWYPTALLPKNGVEWEAMDDQTAMATIEHADLSESVIFHFDEDDLVDHVSTERYRQEDDSYAPWTGHFSAYEQHRGGYIPTEGAVEWNLSDGDLEYWRARLTSVSYETTSSPA